MQMQCAPIQGGDLIRCRKYDSSLIVLAVSVCACVFRYLMENISWLQDAIADYGDDYLIFDCPGQIELYTHLPVMQRLVRFLTKQCGYEMCAIYLLDSLFITDSSRFISGTLMCLSAMVQLEPPHINILTKCDLVPNKKVMRKFLDPDMHSLMLSLDDGAAGGDDRGEGGAGVSDSAHRSATATAGGALSASSSSGGASMPAKYAHLNRAVSTLIEQYAMVNFFPLDITQEDSVSLCLQHIDRATAYGEDLEPKEPKDQDQETLQSIEE